MKPWELAAPYARLIVDESGAPIECETCPLDKLDQLIDVTISGFEIDHLNNTWSVGNQWYNNTVPGGSSYYWEHKSGDLCDRDPNTDYYDIQWTDGGYDYKARFVFDVSSSNFAVRIDVLRRVSGSGGYGDYRNKAFGKTNGCIYPTATAATGDYPEVFGGEGEISVSVAVVGSCP
jgi:hypothetical protein